MYHTANLHFRDFSAPGKNGLSGSMLKTSVEKSLLNKVPVHDRKFRVFYFMIEILFLHFG